MIAISDKMPKPLSVMIVEDQQDIAYLYELHLASLGIESITFDDSLMALEHYKQNHGRYALILLDWTLPIMNGLELAKEIRKINCKVHILLISGHPVKDTVLENEFREANISEVLQKPVRLEDLGPRIIKWCI